LFSFNGLGPVLIVAPATLMQQWVKELSIWFPRCRTAGLFYFASKSVIENMFSSSFEWFI
jgi:SNF2 family DNA or RNA helicase